MTSCNFKNVMIMNTRQYNYCRSGAMKDGVETYNVWGSIITEVEIDMLTGEKNILR